jgi:hypothetical protein
MISGRLVWATIDGGEYSGLVPWLSGEDHWYSMRTEVSKEALRRVVELELAKIAPLSSSSYYLFPAKLT